MLRVDRDVRRLAFRAAGDATRGAYMAAETIWRDPENRTESQHVDALQKLAAIGIPQEQLWADAGYSPQQIKRFLEMRGGTAPAPETPPAPAVEPTMAMEA